MAWPSWLAGESGRTRLVLHLLWLAIGFAQAALTELTDDEAYYWLYAQYPDWGYFDHPPMLAALIALGSALVPGELGVRLLIVPMGSLTLLACERLVRPSDIRLFYLLAASVALVHFYGFMALPDAPLLLFASLFLLALRRFAEEDGWMVALALGVLAACALLSKYHAVLVIGLPVLAQPRLMLRPKLWAAGLLAAVLMLPHLLWQAENGFPSLSYHLYERSAEPYSIGFTLDYLLAQPLVLGPVAGILFFIAAFSYRTADPFGWVMRVLFFGIYGFFLLMTFKGKTEAHWTALAVIPGLWLGYRWLGQHPRLPLLRRLLALSVGMIMAARAVMAWDLLPINGPLAQPLRDFHGKRAWAQSIQQATGCIPVAFMNSYQQASVYRFYSGCEAFSLNNVMGRKNQYDILRPEQRHWGQRIAIVPNYPMDEMEEAVHPLGTVQYTFIGQFNHFSHVRIRLLGYSPAGDSLRIALRIQPCDPPGEIDPMFTPWLTYHYFQGSRWKQGAEVCALDAALCGADTSILIPAPLHDGDFSLAISVKGGWLPPSINSNRLKVANGRKTPTD